MFITEFLGLLPGHACIDFVDIDTKHDTPLFIDPCLIEIGKDVYSQQARDVIADFEDTLFSEMRSGQWQRTKILEQAHEIHDTKLGYGNGRNGKGKTSSGLLQSWAGLYSLASRVATLSRIQDINVFVTNFAEDCMSDLLTNILHLQLCIFTSQQMKARGKEPTCFRQISYWDCSTHQWATTAQPYWEIEGTPVLLVPKQWVRKAFLYSAHQYLFSVIIERIREKDGFDSLPKAIIWEKMERQTEHWEYDEVTDYTVQHPDALYEYHSRMLGYYLRSYGQMTNDALDTVVYGHSMVEIA